MYSTTLRNVCDLTTIDELEDDELAGEDSMNSFENASLENGSMENVSTIENMSLQENGSTFSLEFDQKYSSSSCGLSKSSVLSSVSSSLASLDLKRNDGDNRFKGGGGEDKGGGGPESINPNDDSRNTGGGSRNAELMRIVKQQLIREHAKLERSSTKSGSECNEFVKLSSNEFVEKDQYHRPRKKLDPGGEDEDDSGGGSDRHVSVGDDGYARAWLTSKMNRPVSSKT